ncbi:MAG: hypothetical protein R3A47_04310 [Polyangiales bacterium]
MTTLLVFALAIASVARMIVGRSSLVFSIGLLAFVAGCGGDDGGTGDGGTGGTTPTDSIVFDVGGAQAAIAMDIDRADGFFSFPWPNDLFLIEGGGIDTAGFPLISSGGLIEGIVRAGSVRLDGFGLTSAIHFQVHGELDSRSLPDAESTTSDSTPVLLVIADPESPNFGERVPVIVNFRIEGNDDSVDRLLSFLPYPGHVLREGEQYAVIVFNDLRASDGSSLETSSLLNALRDDSMPSTLDATRWSVLRSQWQNVSAVLDILPNRNADDVAGFTVFTTQHATARLDAIALSMNDLPTPVVPAQDWTIVESPYASGWKATATVSLPLWQEGTPPSFNGAGDVQIASGRAVQQGTATTPIELWIPSSAMPASGWPVLLFMDGTGAGTAAEDFVAWYARYDGLNAIVASIPPLYGVGRQYASTSLTAFLNPFNIVATLTNQLQQAADMVMIHRMMRDLDVVLDAPLQGGGTSTLSVRTDDTRFMLAGHSQGALTVPHVLAIDGDFDAAFLSGASGSLMFTLLHSAELSLISAVVPEIGPSKADEFNPLLNLIQLGADAGASAAYARRSVVPTHVLQISGTSDGCSPVESANTNATAWNLGVTTIDASDSVFGTPELEGPAVTLPIGENSEGGTLTRVHVRMAGDHFVSHVNPSIFRLYFDSWLVDDAPTVSRPDAPVRFGLGGCGGAPIEEPAPVLTQVRTEPVVSGDEASFTVHWQNSGGRYIAALEPSNELRFNTQPTAGKILRVEVPADWSCANDEGVLRCLFEGSRINARDRTTALKVVGTADLAISALSDLTL